jgi:hypothetical protein
MSCMEHECLNNECRWYAADNNTGPSTCPLCGSPVISYYDDDYARDDYDDPNDREPDEDYLLERL